MTRLDKLIWTQKSSQEIPTRPSRPLLIWSIRLVSQIRPHTQLPMPSPGRMGKFENIPELLGMENFYKWRRQTEHLLLGKGVYNLVSKGIDPNNYVEYASIMPTPLLGGSPTLSECEAILGWIKQDGLAKSIILHKVNSTVLALIPDSVSITAQEVWEILVSHFNCSDISLQFGIKTQILNLKMIGARDAEKYVAAHTLANERLAHMGAKPSDTDCIYALLQGLPKSGLWPMIHKTIEMDMERAMQVSSFASLATLSSSASASSTFSTVSAHNPFNQSVGRTYGFHNTVNVIIKEAMQLHHEGAQPGPGSEYANTAIAQGHGWWNQSELPNRALKDKEQSQRDLLHHVTLCKMQAL
ncbi:hypothetical protein PAXRUDRAFT_15411 [Paxillus rubicundulus Ve08.2h10]|uniref:Retrotransposon Copia-like N-terminal domain-containing protein n=1 Tax=Paxillus rubicundulus Ve08.2h10 TaxID=930991 RepID=A0A0D0CEH9_9AGAM|nr:hypothetical protein PAXRUDRAFT_15411 [Paxillus rubicundulus Ve08.2h10]